jgi:hypothetical protein
VRQPPRLKETGHQTVRPVPDPRDNRRLQVGGSSRPGRAMPLARVAGQTRSISIDPSAATPRNPEVPPTATAAHRSLLKQSDHPQP